LRARFHARLTEYLARRDRGSLAARIGTEDTGLHPSDQVAQWLFAFDAGAMTVWRSLAVILAHPSVQQRAIHDVATQEGDPSYLRACFLDTVRLWPTTPLILRQATRVAVVRGLTVPADAGFAIFVPFFHRDSERVAQADHFDPDFWLDRDPATVSPFLPFSAGPAACPGRHVVSLLGALWLRALLTMGVSKSADGAMLDPGSPLPAALDPFKLRFLRQRKAEVPVRAETSVRANSGSRR
jgi:cytochrome P450